MSKYKPIPVEVALQVAQQFDKSMVVILAYDPEFQQTHTTTYGVAAYDKEQAAAVGRLCAAAIGSDLSRAVDFEDFHTDYDPARYRECQETLVAVDHALGSLLAVREGISSELLADLRTRVQRCLSPPAGSPETR